MANKGYLPTSHHRLLSGYSALTSPRSSLGAASRISSSGSPPPEFSYDTYPRESSRNSSSSSSRDLAASYSSRAPTSPGSSSALSMAYSSVQDFPYGLSGVQMPTYNFGSELYNYVSNGFPRKSRMCTFCNKVFTRSTTRRYHERRCPLLRASNSLAKNEENNSSSSLSALKEQQLQQRQKECRSGSGSGGANHNSSLPRTLSSNISNTMASQAGGIPQASPPLPSLHPAYPTSFPKSPAVVSNSSRSSAYSYPHPYSSHFYNSLSAAALASLDQNSKKQESEAAAAAALQWSSSAASPPNSSKLQEQVNSFNSKLGSALTGPLSLTKAFTSESVVDLTARYCADFSLRTRPPVFPAPSLRAPPHSPPSPEPGETNNKSSTHHDDRRESQAARDDSSPVEILSVTTHSNNKPWPSSHRDSKLSNYNNSISSSSTIEDEDRQRRQSTSPASETWHDREAAEPRPYMKVEPLDEDDEEEFEDEDDEDEVEEDEEQFKSDNLGSDAADAEVQSLNYKGTPYNPLICQYCKKIFADVVARKAHEELHSQKKLFACCLCSHSFHCAYSLRIHTLRHHKEGPYKCKYCFIDHTTPSDLRSHLVDEHSLPKAEYQSLKYFNLLDNSSSPTEDALLNNAVSEGEHEEVNRNNFKLHRRSASHSQSQNSYSNETTKALLSPNNINGVQDRDPKLGSESEEATETCKICNKSFAKSYIRLHERTHADQKPYECPICNKRFGYKNNMKSHMKLHQGLKPYQCQICGARFTRGSTLRRHGRRHNVSHSAMLDYVLYDHQRGGGRGGTPTAAATAAALSQKFNMVPTSNPDAKGQYVLPSQSSIGLTAAAVAAAAAAAAASNTPSMPSPDSHTAIKNSKHSAFSAMPSLLQQANELDAERFNGSLNKQRRSPSTVTPRISPPQQTQCASPRGTANPFTSHSSMTNPMVGGLAAVAAANLFGYPNAAAAAAAAPHLYQFYASANPLMAYPPYSANQNAQSVQSDALNLSLGKRKSPEQEENQGDEYKDSKQLRGDSARPDNILRASPDCRINPTTTTTTPELMKENDHNVAAIKTEHMNGSVHGKEHINPFTPSSPLNDTNHKSLYHHDHYHNGAANAKIEPDTDGHNRYHHHHQHSPPRYNHHHHRHPTSPTSPTQQNTHTDDATTTSTATTISTSTTTPTQDELKISTEDFGAQVNICCPSPRVQSSTGSCHLSTSPVGSSSGPDGHLHAQVSPSAASQSSSPVNSAPSPTNPNDGQDLLLSLMTSGRLFRCSFCDIYFTEYAMYRLHQKYHQSDLARPFLCAVCGEDCKDKTYFTVHLSEHLGLGPKNCLP